MRIQFVVVWKKAACEVNLFGISVSVVLLLDQCVLDPS